MLDIFDDFSPHSVHEFQIDIFIHAGRNHARRLEIVSMLCSAFEFEFPADDECYPYL